MAKIVCRKCGATGWSKCPYCRTGFTDNQTDAMLSWVLKWKEDEDEEECEITYTAFTSDPKQAMHQLFRILSAMEEEGSRYPTIDEYCCNHEWGFAPGEKSDIDCGHGHGDREGE